MNRGATPMKIYAERADFTRKRLSDPAFASLNRDRVQAFLKRAAEFERARNALTQMDVMTNSFEERRQARQDCGRKEKEVLDEAAALRKDVPQHELAAHLVAAGAGPDAVREKEKEIRNRIAQEQEKRAALRMSKDRGMSM